MKRRIVIVLLVMVFVAPPSIVSAADEASVMIDVVGRDILKCLQWTHPGRDANRRSLEETVADLGLPTKEDEAKVFGILRPTVVLMSDVLTEIAKVGDRSERERYIKLVLATQKKFFAKEAIEKLGLSAEVVQTILVGANLDMSLYRSEIVGAGYTVGRMVFGKDKKADCVVLQPAPGQPQTIVIHDFRVALSDGNEWDIVHSTICSNAALKGRRPVVKAAEPKPAPPVVVREARVGVIPSTAAIPQFRLIVSLFADREDHFFRNRYNAAKQQPSNKTAYKRAVLEFGHKELIKERRSRSLAKGTFNLFVFDGAGKQIATDQLVTDVKGQALYKMPPEFASVRIVPDHALRDIIPQEGAIHATMEQFQVVWKDWKSATMEVFFIQVEGLDRPGQ